LDLASRRALRVSRRLRGIEMGVKFHYASIEVKETDISRNVKISCNDVEMEIPVSSVQEEFDFIKNNSFFDEVHYNSGRDHKAANAIGELNAKKIILSVSDLNDSELQSIVKNKEEVMVEEGHGLMDGYTWIYETMRDRLLDLKDVRIESEGERGRGHFLSIFSWHHVNVSFKDDAVLITQGHLKITCDIEREHPWSYRVVYL
ncbi:hypothetical protein PMAYCL1PPCAC_13208, partial [Pristionchus mayeri]